MKKQKVSLLLILGACLVLISLGMLLFTQIRLHTGTQRSRQTAQKIQALLPEKTQGIPGNTPHTGMPVLEVDGVDYVGILEVPAFGITLPVADHWDSKKLASGPARFCGSVYESSLVIGGADYAGQFGFCDKIENGSIITVTDMTGVQFSYTVVRVDRASSAKGQWLQDGQSDLTRFCRDMYAMEYIAVRCVIYHG